jgi:ABC-type lipoprotein export system ATPase subunit
VTRRHHATDFTLEFVAEILGRRGLLSEDARKTAAARENVQRARLLRDASDRGGRALRRADLSPVELLASFGLSEHTAKLPDQLSGGQRQRVAVARALANRPAILLADEPTGALDSKTGHEILDLFAELHRQGNTIIIVTHDLSIAAMTQRQVEIHDGLIKLAEAA